MKIKLKEISYPRLDEWEEGMEWGEEFLKIVQYKQQFIVKDYINSKDRYEYLYKAFPLNEEGYAKAKEAYETLLYPYLTYLIKNYIEEGEI